MYRLSYINSEKSRNRAEELADKLKATGLEGVDIVPPEPGLTVDKAFELVENKMCEILAMPLTMIADNLPETIIIGALSERDTDFEKIIYNKHDSSGGPHIYLNAGARIVAFSERAKYMADALFPEWQTEVAVMDMIRTNYSQYDGAIGLEEELSYPDLRWDSCFQFNPREFIPQAGQNVIAFLCLSDDKDVRKHLSRLHIPEVSQATNIERKTAAEMASEGWTATGVHCIVDHNYHYHVYACGVDPYTLSFKKVRYSTATSDQIAKNVIELLKVNV